MVIVLYNRAIICLYCVVMLHLYQSNRLEDLATLLQKIQTTRPLSHPLLAEEIMVQSQGMRRFLSQYLAKTNGIAANLHFSLPADFNWHLIRTVLPDIPALNPFHPEVMRWRLLDLFTDKAFTQAPEFQTAYCALHSYLNSSQHAAYQLAGQLADIFDQYLVYRPHWINAWHANQLLDLGNDEAWQAELWRFLDDNQQIAPHRVAMWQQLLQNLSADKLPERLLVFGIATLAPMYLQLLQAISKHTEVHIFALNPSSEYWGNIIAPEHILKNPTETDLSPSGHPLLASLGKQGRDFFNALIETETQLELPVYHEQISNSLLHQLQYDIQTLTLPNLNANLDNSIRIISTHSPLRELQILKDHILQLLHDHPSWQPHDIAVLTPHIEPYSPFIEAVFGQSHGSAQHLPYSISDIKLSRRQPLLYALEQTLNLLDSRFEVDKVLPLLDNEMVLHRFELTREDLPLLHDTIAQLNIHWGLDSEMRGESNALFTWQQGLERLILGWMLPDHPNKLWQNISAWHSDTNHIHVLSRFTALIRTLTNLYHTWQTPTNIPTWAERVRQLITDLFIPQDHNQQAQQQLENALTRWQEEAALAHFQQTLPQHTVIRHISRFLSSQSDAGFLQGGITFCSMVPMRSLPFKAICLLGLNDGDFPSNTKATSFDLIARHPQKGDRARRDDDRYLFLEAIMSAREHLYLSYIGKSIHNNEALSPSALINELLDTLADMTGISPNQLNQQWIEQHPLQAFSPQYFNQSTFRSSRSDYAEALNQPLKSPPPFYNKPLPTLETPTIIEQHHFLRFWRNPVKNWLQQTLNWQAPYPDEAWNAAEPFTPVRDNDTAAAYLAARRHNENFNTTAKRLYAESMLPTGELGQLWREQYEIAAKSLDDTLLKSPKYQAFPYQLSIGNHTLRGNLEHLHQHGQIHFATQNPNAPEEISLLLEHLIFNAVRPTGMDNYHTHRLQAGNSQMLPEISQNQAIELLTNWLTYYQIGQNQPLPFFPRTSLIAAKALQKNDDPNHSQEQAEKAAFLAYNGSKMSTGQREYPEVALVFEQAETTPLDTPLFWNMIHNMLAPCLIALETTSHIKTE